ncbi:MAG: DUF4010 domain-containing protein [Trueperaceae bacterium]|nr:DUF4010 domain-containing protein [Trueperaceae bacterium]
MPPADAIWSLLAATLLGAMIGLERERKRERAEVLFAGVRTITLIALFGAVGGVLHASLGPAPLLAAFAAVTVLVALGYWRESSGTRVGGTTEVAALLAFALGVLAGLGEHVPALAGAVIVTGTLSLRQELHGFAGALTRRDLLATVRFAVLSLVLLPLVPDAPLGPWGVWNPRTIWTFVLLISGVSFLGYVAVKGVGTRRGIAVSGVLGGLTSSTAVTLAFARRARSDPALTGTLATGLLAASAVAGPRLVLLVWVVEPTFAPWAALPLAAMGAVLGVGVAFAARREGDGAPEVTVRNPFELRAAFAFAGAYALVVLVVRAARETLGASGLLAAAGLAGLTDLDAISLSLAEQHAGGLPPGVAALAVGVAAAANCAVKGVLAATLGGARLGRATLPWLAVAALAAVAAGAAVGPWLGRFGAG